MFVQQVQQKCSACGGRGWTVPPRSTCQPCRGKGLLKEKKTFHVDVEPGASDGAEFRFKGEADELPDHDTGDVVIVIRENQHPVFHRAGSDLVMSKAISLAEALCGFRVSAKFLDGELLEVTSKPGQVMRPGDIWTVRGRGMKRSGRRPGDLHLVLTVEFPASLPEATQAELQGIFSGSKSLKGAGGTEDRRPAPPANSEEASRLSDANVEQLKRRLEETA